MDITTGELARQIGGKVEGTSDLRLTHLARIEEAGEGALTFLHNPKYYAQLYTTGADAVLVGQGFVPEKDRPIPALIHVPNAYGAFITLLKLYYPPPSPPLVVENPSFISPEAQIAADVYIGAFAYIARGARVGRGSRIFPGVYIGENVVVGENTTLFPGVVVYHQCEIGANCVIHAGAVIGADGFGFLPQSAGDYAKIPQAGIVIIEDHVEIGAGTCIDRAVLGATRIKRGVKLDNLVQIAHNVEIDEDCVIAAQTGVAGSVKIGKRCMIGGQVGVVGHLEIADEVKIGAQSGVSKSVPEKGLVLRGAPAQPIGRQLRVEAAMRRLPEYLEKINELEKRLAEMEVRLKDRL